MKKYIEDFTPMRRGSIISRNPIFPYSCWTTAHSRQVAASSHMYTKTIHFRRKTVIQQCYLQIAYAVAVPQWKYPLPHRDDTRSYKAGSRGSFRSSPLHTALHFTSVNAKINSYRLIMKHAAPSPQHELTIKVKQTNKDGHT